MIVFDGAPVFSLDTFSADMPKLMAVLNKSHGKFHTNVFDDFVIDLLKTIPEVKPILTDYPRTVLYEDIRAIVERKEVAHRLQPLLSSWSADTLKQHAGELIDKTAPWKKALSEHST